LRGRRENWKARLVIYIRLILEILQFKLTIIFWNEQDREK
jgi:hypothetical protein